MRLGYLLADPRLVAELIKVKLPYNLGHAGVIAGRVVLEAEEEASAGCGCWWPGGPVGGDARRGGP